MELLKTKRKRMVYLLQKLKFYLSIFSILYASVTPDNHQNVRRRMIEN